MIVVDTSALIAILIGDSEARTFVQSILASDEALVGAPTAFEFRMVAQAERFGKGEGEIDAILRLPRLCIVDWSPILLGDADEAFKRFGKGRHPAKLNFGDCMSYALAKSLGCPLLYKGEDFAKTDIVSAV